jgi:cytochrome c553
MRIVVALVIVSGSLALLAGSHVLTPAATQTAQGQAGHKAPDVVKLALENKLGPVTFSHTNHTTRDYSIDGTGPIACIECHHTAQPATEAAKHPPLQTAWPADRTVTLTAETVKDPGTPAVVVCRDCHARKDEKPKLLPAIPEIKHEGSTALISMTNQQAFHRNCAGCHDEVDKQRPTAKAPKTVQCVGCHKKAA